MKELQNFVYKYMDSLKHHKRYLAMLTALSMLVTFIVPLILIEPADSMTGVLVCKKVVHTHNAECYVGNTLVCNIEEHIHTNECYKKVSLLSLKGDSSNESQYTEYNIPVPNAGSGEYNESTGRYEKADGNTVDGVTYNPAELPLYTLLFGELNDEAKEQGKTHWVDPEQSLVDNLELVDDEYFLGFASDFCAFIESDFTAFDADAEGRVFIGGDLIFKGIPDGKKWNYQVGAGDYGQFTPILQTDEYGHLTGFASGIIGGKVYRLGTMTTGAYASLGGDQTKLLPEGRDPRHTDGNDVFLYPEEGAYKRFVIGNLKDSLHYDEDGAVADIPYGLSCNHLYTNVNCEICKDSSSDHSYLGNVNELSQFYIYDDVRTILEKTFDTLRARSLSLASIESREAVANGNTLTLDATDIGDAKTVYFKVANWDDFTKVDIKVPENRIKKIEKSLYTNNVETITELDLNIIVSCDDREIDIFGTQTLVNDYQISKSGENSTNNHPLSSNILYNFYNATSVTFNGGCNFNGTILAPNANATSPEQCPGHLSGALVAKSFYGGLEFGYRPYRGGVDIFGMTSGYAVPVNKVDQGGATLPGALFAIKEGGKFVSLFESGSGTNFAALPSRVDFTGGTYRQEIVDQKENQDRYYAGNEVTGEKLTADVTITLYEDSDCSKSIASDTNVLTKFYVEANQEVDFDYNENIRFEGPVAGSDGKLVYTVYLIKPVTKVEIIARNKGDNTNCASTSVNFAPMTLTLTDGDNGTPEFVVGNNIGLKAANFPTGESITYKYYVNGSEIPNYNNNDLYKLTVAGNTVFTVKAIENGCEVAQATVEQYIAPYNLPSLSISAPDLVTSGTDVKVELLNKDKLSTDAKITYTLNNTAPITYDESGNAVFSTNGIIGNDILIRVSVEDNGESTTLERTITVGFSDMAITYESCSYDKENDKWFYVVNSDTNDKLNFSVSGLPTGATVKYYFKDTELTTDNNSASITKTVIGEDIPVRAVVSLNGMEKTIYGSVTGKYNDGLSLNVQQQAGYIVGNEIKINVTNAPNGANVVFNVYDSYGNFVKTLETKTVENGEAWSSYTPEKSGEYYFKAVMTYGDNPVKELRSANITVIPVTLTGELSVTPNQVSTGNEVTIKVYGATIGADVTFTVEDQNGNAVHTISGLEVGDNGECKGTYKPTQAGNYTVKAAISKGDTPRNLQSSFTAIESTSALSGTFTLSRETITPGSDIDIVVSSPNNGAVVNIKITNPNGKTYTQSANINNGGYNFTFNSSNLDNVAGVYTVSVELVQGTSSQSLGDQKFTVSSGNDASGEISVSPESIVIGNSIDVNITNAPVGANVAFKYYYYDSDISQYVTSPTSATIGDEGTYNLTFSPAIVGKYTVKATITTANGSVKEVETSFYAHAIFEIDNDGACVAGEWHNISVSGIEKQTISSVQQFTIEGQTVSEYNIVNPSEEDPEGKPYISFRTSEQYTGGTYNLYLKIQLSGGAVTEYRTQITNSAATDSAMLSLRNTSLKNASFLKNINILADESTDPDNLIEIIPEEDGERISSVRLTFPDSANAKNNSFKLAVTFTEKTESEEKTYTKEYTKDNVAGENPAYIDILTSEIPGDVDIDKNNITKISITSVAGSIAVDKCYPTYVKAENQITKTYTKGFTLNPNEQKEIVIENWLETLDSITFNLDSDGEIFYALIGADETETLVSGSAKSENGNKKIEITGINDNIKKIKIFTKQESPLTVKDYTIIGFTGDTSYDTEELKNNEWDVINYYTLVEQQAPVGYFKEETVYTIEVKETVDRTSNGIPTNVLTTISVKDKNGIVVLSYSVNTEYGDDNKKITILDNDPENTDVKFTLTENNGVVTVKDSSGEVLNWDTSKPGLHVYGDKEYYLDPTAMMIVPVPESIEYTNRKALLFRKVDDGGAIVKEVMIQMYEYGEVTENNETKWKWKTVPEWKWSQNETSEWLLSIDGDEPTIKTDTYYRFHESDAGGKYELTDDIYMIRDSENPNEIHYWIVDRDTTETDPANTKPAAQMSTENPTGYNVLDLTRDNVIRMSNYKIPGVKLSLSKTELGGSVITDATQDAVFNLYANDGTLLQKDITVTNGHIDLNLLSVTDTEGLYVEEGYLKPGTYFLREMKAPTGYEASVSDFYFSVLVDKNGVYSIKGEESTPGVVRLNETQSDGSVHRVLKFQQKALERLAELDPYTPVIQFKFNTSGNEKGYGNAKFSAIVNGAAASPVPSAYPSGCDSHTNGISFQSEEVMVQLSVNQLCALFGVAVENFSTITEFSINCWNSTTISDVDFYPLENPIYYTTTSTQLMILESGLRRITDDMITDNAEILEITFKSSKKGYNAKFYGPYFDENKNEYVKKENSIECSEGLMTISLTAKDMLKKIGVGLEDSITAGELIEEFGKLSAFGSDAWDGTEITNVTFNEALNYDNTDDTTPELQIPSITVDGTDVKVSNDEIKNVMKLRVEKKWQGDNGATELRQPVTVTLKRKVEGSDTYQEYTPSDEVSGEQRLSSENDWTYTWENLPRFVNENDPENSAKYYYTVVETPVTGYTGSLVEGYENFNESGTITLTNTANVIDIPVSKSWNSNGYSNVIPDSIMFKLQASLDGNSWIDLPQKTIVVTKSDNWEGKFENLPVGYQYRVEEGELPYDHWSVENSSVTSLTATKADKEEEMESGFAVTNTYNPPEGGLTVNKQWIGDTAADRPEQLKLKVYRTIAKPYYEETDAPYVEEGNDYKSDYARLLQHSLYFYDANMCGADVSANSALAWRSNCHLEDEVQGGYHDAGDHVMFGLPQGYTATMLSWTYLEFFKDGTNANEANKSIDSADKEHLKLILDRFYDFFVNSVKYDSTGEISEILVQKGHGNVDHLLWCSPETQKSRDSEMIWSSTSGANIAAEYAAALALGYLNFKDTTTAVKWDKYLEVAEKLYRYAEKTSAFQAGDSEGNYYQDGDKEDDMQLAAAWLYEATGDESYKGKRLGSDKDVSKGLQWDDVQLAAAMATARQEGNWEKVKKFIADTYTKSNSFYYIHEWGTARFNAMAQTAILIAAKYNPDERQEYVNWATGQMNKILGDNNWKDTISENGCTGGTIDRTGLPVCLVTNFAPDEIYSPQAPHHRAASGWETHEDYKNNCGYNTENSHQLIGALAGGPAFKTHTDQAQMNSYQHDHPRTTHNYIDDLHDYCCNEVAIDYNAGLVGAAAGLFYFTGTGERSTKIEGVEIEAMGGTPEYTVAYAPSSLVSSNAYTLERVSIQSGYNMVPLRRTAVSVLEDTTWTSGKPVSVNLENVVGIKITFAWNGVGGFNYNAHDTNWAVQGSGSSEVYEQTFENPVYIGSYQVDVNVWNSAVVSIVSVEFITQSTEFDFTSDTPQDNTTHNLRQGITFKTNEAATWTSSLNDSSIVQLTTSSDNKECTVKFLKYTDQAVTITATSISDPTKSVNRTISANKATLSLDKSELEVGENVTFTVNNVTNDGNVSYEYYVNGEILVDANSNPYTYTAPTEGEKSVYAVAKSGDVEVDRTAAQTFTVKAAIPKINGASEMFEGETKTYELDGATSWKVETNTNFASIDENGNLSSIANVDNNTTVQISAKLGETTITKDVIIKPITISDQSMGTSETITVELGDVTGNYQWKVESETPAALGSISSDTKKCTINSVANTGSFIIGLYINDSSVSTNKLTQFTVNVADGAFNLVTDNDTTINVGGNIYLRAEDNRNISRLEIVSGQNYVSVNQQNVYGLAPGTVVIVAIDQNNERSAQFTITVTELDMDLTGISNMIVGQQKSLSEQNNITNWSWEFSAAWSVINNDNVVEFNTNEKKITALNPGTFTLKVEIKYNQNNNSNIIAKTITEEITVAEYVPTTPTGYNLITSYTYPEDNKTVNLNPDDLIIELDTILGNHPVDAVIVEFESCNGNGVVYWDANSLDKADGSSKLAAYKYDSVSEFTVLFKDVGYTDGQTQPEYFAIRNWYGSVTVKKVHFYAKTLVPTIVNTFKDSNGGNNVAVGDEPILKVVGFTNTENIQWTVEGGTATIENGVFKPLTQGTYTIKATNGSETATTTIEVARIPIKIGFNEALDEVTKTVKYTDTVTLRFSEPVEYEIVSEARSNIGELVKIENNKVSVIDTDSFGTAKVTVTIQGYVTENGEKVISNQVQVTFVGQVYITGISELAPNKSTTLKAENALGEVTWSVAEDEAYNVSDADADGIITVTDKDNKIILKLDTSNGKITAGEASGTVNIQATADDDTAEHTVVVKDLPMQPIIPTEGKELVDEIILTGNDWSASLANLPVEDEKGNIYYYYVEEYAYKKSASDKDWTLIYTPESLGFIHANGSYMPVSYNENGNSLIEDKTSSFTVGNKATEKPQGQLPSTGGSGVTTYYYLGGVIMLLSIAGFTSLKRRERKRRKE